MQKKRLAVMVSGHGGNLQAIMDAMHGELGKVAELCLVLSNDPEAYAIERAMKAEIPAISVPHQFFDDRIDFENALLAVTRPYRIEVIALAGFMRMLTPVFIAPYLGRMLNIHPSLLPKFRGLNTHQAALEAQEKSHGCTVHFVTPELDAGPIVAQSKVNVIPGESPDELGARVYEKELQLYPETIQWLCSGRLVMNGNNAYLDGKEIEIKNQEDEEEVWERTE